MSADPIALVVGPWRDATRDDHLRMEVALADLLTAGWAPIFYPLALENVLDDHDPEQRGQALAASESLVRQLARAQVAGVAVGLFVVEPGDGLHSEGMRRDLCAWSSEGAGWIYYLRDEGVETLRAYRDQAVARAQ